ncbi:MAG TPA: sigma-70 family RNA polymerase sigma factor [Acidimicrobiales bacterium]|nr:sigma-70 family RNA polymerase sigma factor [Acidimicrobiales bacterium]
MGVTASADSAEVFRRESARAVATLIKASGDWDLAEDAVQEAFVVALDRWPVDGVPDNPGAWITTTARRKMLDRIRREAGRAGKERLAVAGARLVAPALDEHIATGREPSGGDDRLRLMFTCCHPTLSESAQVALTLRLLGGLTTTEIARAFLVPEATVAQRIVRAKRKIRDAHIPYRIPSATELGQRLDAVAAVLYLLFNEGYATASGTELVRVEMADEAIRLARLLAALLPDAECVALLALLLLQHARRAARVDEDGELVTLAAQDRTRWDKAAIAEATALLAALPSAPRGFYRVQADIAAAHATSISADDTDWPRVVELYDELVSLRPTSVVLLNRAVAVAEASGPLAGLAALRDAESGGDLADYHLFHAARAELLARAGRRDESVDAFRRALALTANDVERRHLERRLRAL